MPKYTSSVNPPSYAGLVRMADFITRSTEERMKPLGTLAQATQEGCNRLLLGQDAAIVAAYLQSVM